MNTMLAVGSVALAAVAAAAWILRLRSWRRRRLSVAAGLAVVASVFVPVILLTVGALLAGCPMDVAGAVDTVAFLEVLLGIVGGLRLVVLPLRL